MNEDFLRKWEATNRLYKIASSHLDTLPDWVKKLSIKDIEKEDQSYESTTKNRESEP